MTYDPYRDAPSFDPRGFGSAGRKYDAMAPRPANPFSSLYGGPTPWEQSIQQYQSYGSPNIGKRPFEGLGKTNVAVSLPFAPQMGRPRDAAPTPVGAPQPGLFEALGSGLSQLAVDTVVPLDILTQPFGSGLGKDIETGAVNLIGAIGSVFDGILDFVPNTLGVSNIGFLPGGGDIASVYDALPEDALKQEYDALISQNPTARLEYMKQFLDARGPDIARMQGFSGAFSELASPSASFSEQLRRIIFGGMMLPQQAINRTFVGSGLRDVEGSILNRDDSELPEELRALKARHLSGEINRDEFLDELLLSEYRWTNSDGPESFFINLALDIVTDPIIWASMGTASAASVVARTAGSSARLATTGALRNAVAAGDTLGVRLMNDVARRANWRGSPQELLKSALPEHHKMWHEAIRKEAPDLYKQGMGTLNKRQRVAYELQPVIEPASKIANEIDTMFGFFGAGKIAGRMGAFRSSKHVEGFARGAGVRVVKELQDFFGDEFDTFNRYFGVSAGNLSMALGARLQVDQLLASGRAVDNVTAAADPTLTPTQIAKQHRQMSLKGLDHEAEAAYLKYQETFLPKGEFGDAALDKAVTDARNAMVPDLASATGKSVAEAQKFLDAADRRQLAFTHWVLYGKQVVDFNDGKEAYIQAVKGHIAAGGHTPATLNRLNRILADAERYTLVSDNTLTKQDAAQLVAALTSGDPDAGKWAIDAINQYDQLDANFGQRTADVERVRLELVKHLQMLLDKDALITVVDASKVNSRVAAKLSDRYRVGLMPSDVWGITKDEAGNIIGVNPFVEALSDAQTGLSNKVGRMDRIRAALADPIRGSKLHAENKIRFRVEAARNFKLRKAEADRLFNAINKEAITRQKGARAFGAHELNQIAKDVGIELAPDLKAKYGERGILHLVLTAFEGDIALYGLSSAASARIKSRFGRLPMGDNLIGKIAEDYYPKLRFSASPIFLAMEWVEGPFFAILRGIKPGWKYTEQDLRNLQILDTLRPDYAEVGAGIGRAQLAFGDQQIALRVQDIGRWGKAWNKVMPVKALQRPQKRIVGPHFYNIYDLKRVLYQRQAATQAAESFVRAMKEEMPDAYKEWANAAGSTQPIKIWTTFMEDRGWFNPTYRHTLHMFDAQRGLAQSKDRIRMGDVAHYLGFADEGEMRAAINNGSYNRTAFDAEYAKVNANPEYVERAWRNANGFTVEEWTAKITEAIGPKEAEATLGLYRFLANASKRNLDEYLNDVFGNIANIVDKSNQVPASAFRQSVKDTMEKAGMTYYTRTSPEFIRAQRYMRQLLPQQDSIARLDESYPAGPKTEWVKARDLPDIPAGNVIDQKKVNALAKSMREFGWQGEDAIDVTYYQKTNTIDVGEGNHRLLAAKKAGVEVPVVVTRLNTAGPETALKVRDLANEDGYVPASLRLSEVIDLGGPTGSLRRKITNAQLNIADPANTKHLPPQNSYTQRSYQQMWEDVQAVLGENTIQYSNWYDEMMSTWLGLTSKMDDATIQKMLDVWEERAPQSMRGTLPKDIEEGRIMLAARLNVAFSGSQMNTSVLDGMRKVTTILEETLKDVGDEELYARALAKVEGDSKLKAKYDAAIKAGDTNAARQIVLKKIDTRFGFEAVRGRLESVIRDFGALPEASIAQKLSDFNDNLAGYMRRSSSPMDGLQPAAMDIWMKRVWGYPDSAYFDDLVRHHMHVQEAQGTPITREAAEEAVLKDREWDRDWVRELTDEEKKELEKAGIEEGAPTPQQYEWMLRKTNEFKDWLNDNGIEGPNGEWAAHEIQALLWVGEQKRLLYPDNPTFSLFQQTGRQLAPDPNPGKMNEAWKARFPTREELIAELGAEADAVMQSVGYEVTSQVLKEILPETKSTVIRTLDGSEELGTTIVFGSEAMSLETAHHLAAALDREVVVMGRPPDVTLKATSTKPDPASNIKEQGRHWSFDFAFDPDIPTREVQQHLTSLREFLDQYLEPDEFPHALTALLDDNATSLRYAWDSRLNEQVATYIEGVYNTRRELLDTTGSVAKRVRTDAEKKQMAALKKRLKDGEKITREEQAWLDEVTANTGSKDISLRTPEEQAAIDAGEKEVNRAAAGQMNLRQLRDNNPLPDHVYEALESGEWVKAFDPDAEPVRIELRHEQVNYQVITPEEGVARVGNPDTVRRYRAAAQNAAEGAYADLAPNALAAHQQRSILSQGGGDLPVFNQRELSGAGRVRAGFDYRTGQHDAAIYLVRNLSDASSVIHEGFHAFARTLDPSAQRLIIDGYNAAHGLVGPRAKYGKRKLTRVVEEWIAAEFELWAAKQGLNKTAMHYSTFKAFGEWAKNDPRISASMKHSVADGVLDTVMADLTDIPAGFRDLDEYRLNESARISLLKAEEQAHSTAYYRRGPNWMSRSINHPYLGMYPASYMWGKVLPELTRFLLKKPFGLNAPLGGLAMYNHVHRGIAEQFYFDEEMNQFIEDHPDTVRFLEMMLPGNPVEMPVNMPVVARRAMEHDAKNRMADLAGQPREDFDLAGAVGDMASYAVGFAQLPDRVGKMIGEWTNEDGPNDGKTLPFNPRQLGNFGPKLPGV